MHTNAHPIPASNSQAGFTLIEIMIVTVIIGILAAIAIPSYLNYVGKSQTVEGFTVSNGLRSEIAAHVWENKRFPNASEVAVTGVIGRQANSLDGKYVAENGISVTPNTGIITVNFDAGNIAGKTLILTPEINTLNNQQVIQWVCSGTVGANILPTSCQS